MAINQTGNWRRHGEQHRGGRANWLRAGVLGANDGILSTGALLLGVVSAGADRSAVLTAGIAGLVAGAGSMSLGEYVSVSSQRDAERAERIIEAAELQADPQGEQAELRRIYEGRGLSRELADTVATELMAVDALGSHLRDELGQTEQSLARPIQAAVVSFFSFAIGALLAIAAAALAPASMRGAVVAAATLVGLSALGGTAAYLGGAQVGRGMLRVAVGGTVALAVTFAIGDALGTVIA